MGAVRKEGENGNVIADLLKFSEHSSITQGTTCNSNCIYLTTVWRLDMVLQVVIFGVLLFTYCEEKYFSNFWRLKRMKSLYSIYLENRKAIPYLLNRERI